MCSTLWWEVDSAKEFSKPWVGSQIVDVRVHLKLQQARIAKGISLFQPLKCGLAVRLAYVSLKREDITIPVSGAQQSALAIVAQGALADGRTFTYQAVEAAGELQFVRIEFK